MKIKLTGTKMLIVTSLFSISVISCGKDGKNGKNGINGTGGGTSLAVFPGVATFTSPSCSDDEAELTKFLELYSNCVTTPINCTWTCYSDTCGGTASTCPLASPNDTNTILLPSNCDLSAALGVGYALQTGCGALAITASTPAFSCEHWTISCT